MREEEKILISAFFDDELINEEKTRAENLIANDPEAYEYFQTLKVLDNELSTFASKSLSSKQAQDAFQFIDNLKPDSDQASSGFFSKLFGLQNGSVSALTNNRLGLAFSTHVFCQINFSLARHREKPITRWINSLTPIL